MDLHSLSPSVLLVPRCVVWRERVVINLSAKRGVNELVAAGCIHTYDNFTYPQAKQMSDILIQRQAEQD